MSATFDWIEDNSTATGSPAKGTTRTTGRTDVNWKSIDDSTSAYSSYPVAGGTDSFEKWQFAKWSGAFDQISSILFAHTAGAFGAGETLVGPPACTSDGTRLLYTTPSQSPNSNLTTTMTTAIAIGSGVACCAGATGPEATGKAASMTTNPCYSNYLTTQVQTITSAPPGDTPSITMTLQYAEN